MKDSEIKQFLKDHQLKSTPVRMAVIKTLLSKDHLLLTIDEILKKVNQRLKKKNDWSTLFRTLKTFEDCGIVSSTILDSKSVYYEINLHSHHHHHLICRDCGDIKSLKACELASLDNLANQYNYSNVSHKLEFFGTCPDCQ
jgi:Fe2+ or Zn2+ uptake regulation protein